MLPRIFHPHPGPFLTLLLAPGCFAPHSLRSQKPHAEHPWSFFQFSSCSLLLCRLFISSILLSIIFVTLYYPESCRVRLGSTGSMGTTSDSTGDKAVSWIILLITFLCSLLPKLGHYLLLPAPRVFHTMLLAPLSFCPHCSGFLRLTNVY